MKLSRYLLIGLLLTAIQVLILLSVYGNRLTTLDVPLHYSWTDPPAVGQVWRPETTSNDVTGEPIYDGTYSQVDTPLALAGANLIERGTWYGSDDHLSMPGGYTTLDFPVPFDRGNILIAWVLSVFAGSPVVLSNVFFLLTFFSILWVSLAYLWIWRPRSKLLVPLMALAVTNAPYHFIREAFFAASYLVVVPAIVCCILLLRKRDLTRAQTVGVGIWVVAAPFFGLYWAIASTFLASWVVLGLLLARLSGARPRLRRSLLVAGWLWVWVVTWLVVDMTPSIRYWSDNGVIEKLRRTADSNDLFALRLLDLVLLPDTAPGFLSAFARSRWIAPPASLGEGVVTGGLLGLVAGLLTLGFLSYAATRGIESHRTSSRQPAWMQMRDARSAIWLGIGVFLASTYGGLGTAANLIGVAVIKSWERFAFLLYPLSLILVGLAATSWWQWSQRERGARTRPCAAAIASVSVVIFSILVAIPASIDGHGSAEAQRRWTELADFYARVDARSVAGPVIYLPAEVYPEGPSICSMPVYASLYGYALTTRTAWGSAAYRGRPLSESQYALTISLLEDPAAFIRDVVRAGYRRAVVDLRGIPSSLRASVVNGLSADSDYAYRSPDGSHIYFEFGSNPSSDASAVESAGEGITPLKEYQYNRAFPPCSSLDHGQFR